jgi:hypothetical protein
MDEYHLGGAFGMADGTSVLNFANVGCVDQSPPLLSLNSILETLEWYERNLCRPRLLDPRGYRVRFLAENFPHLIQLKNKYGEEPRNARLTLENIRDGRIQFVAGRFDPQRTAELSWAPEIATNPNSIHLNWQVLGRGDEAFLRSFGTEAEPKFRVLICQVIGTIRQVVTIFPRERISQRDLLAKIWP